MKQLMRRNASISQTFYHTNDVWDNVIFDYFSYARCLGYPNAVQILMNYGATVTMPIDTFLLYKVPFWRNISLNKNELFALPEKTIKMENLIPLSDSVENIIRQNEKYRKIRNFLAIDHGLETKHYP